MFKKLFKRLTGLDKVEQHLEETRKKLEEAVDKTAEHLREAEKARLDEVQAKLTPKERATAKGEPWVGVLETHVNKDNLRNGFFELDWNDEFIIQLKQQGYGFDGDPVEEIVDRWFRALCSDVASDEGISMDRRGAGYIDTQKLVKKESEV
jgi:hypothetical protein